MKSPFKFLDAYTAQDKDIFYGRDKEVEALYDLVFKSPLVLVYGLSGTGKTSLVQCGLSSKFDGPEWNPFLIRRGTNINDAIHTAFQPSLGGPSKGSLAKDVAYIFENYFRPVYLIFDQFEELFILGGVDERKKFVKNLTDLMKTNLPCKVLLIVREEYLGQLYPFEREIPTLLDFRFRVEAMGEKKVSNVIKGSFEKFNIKIEDPVDKNVGLMVENLNDAKSRIALPYLQVYMDNLYRLAYAKKYGNNEPDEKYPEVTITRQDIIENGEIKDVLEKFLEQQEKALTVGLLEKHPDLKSDTLQKLLDSFVTEDGTKRPMTYQRDSGNIVLADADAKYLPELSPQLLDDSIDALEASRLLRVSDDSIELAHDSLALLIDQRRSDEQREINKVRKRLLNSFDEYRNSGAPLTARQIRSFEGYMEQLDVDQEVLNFVKFSEGEIQKQEQAKRDLERKDYELEQEKKKAELIEAKLAAEQRKNVLEKKNRNLLRGMIAAIGIALVGLAGFTYKSIKASNLETANLTSENVALEAARKEISNLNASLRKSNASLDSVVNHQKHKIDLVDGQIQTVQDMAMGKKQLELIPISNANLFVKGILLDRDSLELAREIYHASIYDDNLIMTSMTSGAILSNNSRLPRAKTEFRVGDVANVYAGIRAPKSRERITVEWILGDEVLKTQAENVDGNISYRGSRLIKAYTCRDAGDYKVRISNQMGTVIGETGFTVK